VVRWYGLQVWNVDGILVIGGGQCGCGSVKVVLVLEDWGILGLSVGGSMVR